VKENKRRISRLLILASLATCATCATTSAGAQQLAQSPAPETQALAQKLMAEINAGIQCSSNAIALQQQVSADKARIKELEDKYEPKKDAPQ
jgi:hypothetical protein